jgi:Ser/Thr protein kinase RdoA (MazF antagonist)
MPSSDGQLVERWGDRQLAVLEYVGGIPLAATPEDQQAVGTTLARVHQISQAPVGDLEKWFELTRRRRRSSASQTARSL